MVGMKGTDPNPVDHSISEERPVPKEPDDPPLNEYDRQRALILSVETAR